MTEDRKPRRVRGCLARTLLLCGAAAVLAYVTRTHTLFPLATGLAERFVEARFDADLVLEGLDGDGWRTLSATRVELRAHDGSPTRLRLLDARELAIELSLFDLLRGREGWLRAIRAASVATELDLTRPGSGSDGEGRLGPVPEVDIAELSGRVELGGGRSARVGGGSLRSTPTPEGPELSLIGVAAEVVAFPDAAPYSGRVSGQAVLTRDELRIASARLDGEQIRIFAQDVRAPWEGFSVAAPPRAARAELEIEVADLLARLGARGDDTSSLLTAAVSLRDGALEVRRAELVAAGGTVRAERGRLDLEPSGEPRWNLALVADVPRVEDLEGLLGTSGWTGALRGRAAVEGVGMRTTLDLDLTAERLELADVRFGSGTLTGQARLDLLRPQGITGRANVRAAPAWVAGRQLDELVGDVELTETTLHLREVRATQPLNRLEASDLILPRRVDPASVLAGASGSVELELGAVESLFPEEITERPPEHRIALAASIADGVATLTEGRLEVAGGGIRVERGNLRLARSRAEVVLDLTLRVDLPDLAPLGALVGEPDLAGSVSGTARATGRLDAPRAEVDLVGADLVLRGVELTEVGVAGEVAAGEVRFERLRAVSRHATIEAVGELAVSAERTTGSFTSLRIARDDDELALREPFAFALEGERITVDPFALVGSAGSFELALKRDGERWSAEGRAVGLDLEQVLPGSGLGRADGRIAIEGAGDDLRTEIAATLSGWRVPGFEGLVDAEIDLEQTGVELAVRNLEVASTDGVRATFTGSAPFRWNALLGDGPRRWEDVLADGELSFRATSNQLPLARIAWSAPWDSITQDGVLSLVAELTGTWAAPRGSLDLDVDGLRWTGPRDLAVGRLSAELALEPDAVTAAIATDQPARFAASGRLFLGAPVDARELLLENFDRLLLASLELDLDVEGEDLAWLPVRVEGVRRAAGSVTADLGLRGSIAAPRWQGMVVLAGGELKLESDLPSLVDVEGELELADREVRLTRLSAELGGAPVSTQGKIGFPVGQSPTLSLAFQGERLLLRRDPEIVLRADADLELTGTWREPVLSGALDLRRSWLSKRITLLDLQPGSKPARVRGIPLFSFREPPFRDMELDLAVTSSESIVLRGNVARGGLRPDLRITGTGEVPRIGGSIVLDPTTVSLPGARVLFRTGTLTFVPSDPFVPRLQLVGRTEKFGHLITAVVTGPYDAPEVELSASPPLSSEEIVLILAAGRPPTGFTSGSIEATQNVAIYIAQDFASTWLAGDEDDEASFLERVEVVTGRDVSRNGQPTIEIRLRIGDDFPIKGGRVYLAGERDVYEDSNLGVRFSFHLR